MRSWTKQGFCQDRPERKFETRNSKLEIRNKSEIRITECPKLSKKIEFYSNTFNLGFGHLRFENLKIVSDFGFRNSDLIKDSQAS